VAQKRNKTTYFKGTVLREPEKRKHPADFLLQGIEREKSLHLKNTGVAGVLLKERGGATLTGVWPDRGLGLINWAKPRHP